MGKRTISKLNVRFLSNYVLVSQIIFGLALLGGILVLIYSRSREEVLISVIFSNIVAIFQMVFATNIARMAEQIEFIKEEIVENKMGISLSEYSDDPDDPFNSRENIDRWFAEEDVYGMPLDGECVEFSEEELGDESSEEQTPESKSDIDNWLNG